MWCCLLILPHLVLGRVFRGSISPSSGWNCLMAVAVSGGICLEDCERDNRGHLLWL